ncbi:MAG TPA: hypothetical protein PLP19_19550 [bacterium]|nr:hypothetical protein [bacterium]HPN45693.1 hypothetical protein [bacterium]
MYSIAKQYSKIYSTSQKSLDYFKLCNENSQKNFIFASGVINFLWQSWNRFWRNFWLAYLLGGEDLKKQQIISVPSFSGKNEFEAIHYILYLIGKRKTPSGMISASYQEPTWGDVDCITKISTNLSEPGTDVDIIKIQVLNALSVLGDTPRHLQIVRNTSIHLNWENITNLHNRVLPFYAISNINYPTEILYSKEIRTSKIAIQHWVDDLLAVVSLIYI